MVEGFLNARRAAAYVGYEPGTRFNAKGHDLEMRAFYEFVRRHGVANTRRGRRLVFRRVELDRALGRCTEEAQHGRLNMAELARRHARGEDLGPH